MCHIPSGGKDEEESDTGFSEREKSGASHMSVWRCFRAKPPGERDAGLHLLQGVSVVLRLHFGVLGGSPSGSRVLRVCSGHFSDAARQANWMRDRVYPGRDQDSIAYRGRIHWAPGWTPKPFY